MMSERGFAKGVIMFGESNGDEEPRRPSSPGSLSPQHLRSPYRFLKSPDQLTKDAPHADLPIHLMMKRFSNEATLFSPSLDRSRGEAASLSVQKNRSPHFSFERGVCEDHNFSILLKKCDEDQESRQSFKSMSSQSFVPVVQTELTLFQNLFFLCLKVFSGERIQQEDLVLAPTETVIFNCILQRKFFKKNKISETNFSSMPKLSELEKVLASKNLKRPEECYKFIHTRVLKHLKRKFRSSFNIKKDLDRLFYTHYFHSVSTAFNLPIEKFVYPLASSAEDASSNLRSERKTLNADYFRLLFSSKHFKKGFEDYTRHVLLTECRADIIQKLERLLLKWEKQIKRLGVGQSLEEIKTYLLTNKHCKLPWTLGEIENSIHKLNGFGEQVQPKLPPLYLK